MAYKFLPDGFYSIEQAQKRLELSDDELERCLDNGWLRLALPQTAIPYTGHLAALPVDQAGHLPDEPEEQADMLHPLPEYAYSVGEYEQRGPVVFEDLSGNSFLLAVVQRYTATVLDDAEVTAPFFSRQGESYPNAETRMQVNPVTAWHLAQAICGKEYGFNPEEIISGHLVVTEEEVERFKNEYETAFTEETKKESDAKSHERLNEQGPPGSSEARSMNRLLGGKDLYLKSHLKPAQQSQLQELGITISPGNGKAYESMREDKKNPYLQQCVDCIFKEGIHRTKTQIIKYLMSEDGRSRFPMMPENKGTFERATVAPCSFDYSEYEDSR